jgi:hypothetical protein
MIKLVQPKHCVGIWDSYVLYVRMHNAVAMQHSWYV